MNLPPLGALSSPAALRNRDAIRLVLQNHLPLSGLVLEIAAGTGEHAVHLAAAFPHLSWRPTDPSAEARASIAAWRRHEGSPNLLEPLPLDAADPGAWPVARAAAVVCVNMIHIAPWAATLGLMAGAGRILPSGGRLYLYGPFLQGGAPTAPTNAMFDENLRRRDSAWGVRDLEEVAEVARVQGLDLKAQVGMPANNLSVVFIRR